MVTQMRFEAFNKNQSRAEAAAALAASILLHLLLIFAIAFFLFGMARVAVQVAPEQPDEPLQVTIIPPLPVEKPKPVFVETPESSTPTGKPKKDTPFESNNDSIAASEAPPEGSEPLPTLTGLETLGLAFRDQDYTLGESAQAAAPSEAAPPTTPTESAEPAPTPKAEVALLETPAPQPKPSAPPTVPKKPATASPGGYQPETRVTRLKGNVSNRNRASLEAEATPLGRYKKQVSDAIGSRWYYYVNSQLGLLNIGRVEIRFTVSPEGKIKNPQVLSNSSNESFASVSLAAIMAAKIPPIPPDVAKILENGRLEIDYSFSILGN